MAKKLRLGENMQVVLFWLALFALLALTAWCSRYWLSSEFGLYEDDLTFMPGAIEADFPSVMQMVSGYLSTLAEQGRPLMWSWVVFFAHLGWAVGGLQGMYILAYLIWLTNITLFVLLLRKIDNDKLFIALGGLAYVLFSADTNQAFLFNAYGLQTAITFLLIALHLYLSNRKLRWLAYVFLTLIMFNYETPFWPFLAAPLLLKAEGKALKKPLLSHSVVMVVIFIVIYGLRLWVGETRAAGLGFPEMITTPIMHMLIGPIVGIGAYFLRLFLVLRQLGPGLGLAVLLSAGIITAFLLWVFGRNQRSTAALWPIKKGWWNRLDRYSRRMLQAGLAGLVMLVLAYPLTIILRPYAISGRESRVHLAAVVGAALLLASVISLFVHALGGRKLQTGGLVLVSLLFGFNFAFGFIIQKDYQRAWDIQQKFWRDLLPLIPDIEDGTVIMVEPSGLEDVLYIDANTWNLPRVLPQLFVFPGNWQKPPRAFRLISNWQNHILRLPGYFTIDVLTSYSPDPTYGDFLQGKAIFIATADGELKRRSEPLPLEELIPIKPMGKNVLQTFDTRPLYGLLIEDD